jgi:hypothetical protein
VRLPLVCAVSSCPAAVASPGSGWSGWSEGDVGCGSGSSKAGRAWCQGASGLRGAVRDGGAVSDAAVSEVGVPDGVVSGVAASAAGRWLAEPSEALRERRGPAGAVPVSGRCDVEPSLALRARRAGGAAVVADSGPSTGSSVVGSADVPARWLAEP